MASDRLDGDFMKHGVKPTREQRMLMAKWKLNSRDWLVVKDEPTRMTLQHRYFDHVIKIIPKGGRYDGNL